MRSSLPTSAPAVSSRPVMTRRGPVRVPDEEGHERQIEHEVWLPQDFPFTGPVRPVDPLPGPQWHMEHTGHLCLYPTDPGSLPDWDDAQALLERVAGWYVEHHAGWPSDPGDLDLDRYFPGKDTGILVVYEGSLANLTGRRLDVTPLAGLSDVYKLARGRQLSVDSNGHRRTRQAKRKPTTGAPASTSGRWKNRSTTGPPSASTSMRAPAASSSDWPGNWHRHRPCSLRASGPLRPQSGRRRVAPVALFEPDA